ncbi:alpha,alpha-trehalase nth1 [Blastocladiella emersonii ATCC 22665]|nr:alpha,alpha-trehalase nth1 [Blastocladiella emersonii ATCC 22665]
MQTRSSLRNASLGAVVHGSLLDGLVAVKPEPGTEPAAAASTSPEPPAPKKRRARGVKAEPGLGLPELEVKVELPLIKAEPGLDASAAAAAAFPTPISANPAVKSAGAAPDVKLPRKRITKPSPSLPATPVDAPAGWEPVYASILAWRRTVIAPVDTVGCGSLADPAADDVTRRFHTLVALMLSSQTKDEVTGAAMANLKAKGLTVDSVLAWSDAELNAAICKVGFHRRKTEYIKKTAAVLKEKYGGDIPPTVDELIALPGVGPKMAYLTMQHAWGQSDGIGVDVHVHRISNRLGWVNTKTPEQTRLALQSWLPRDKWGEINSMLVGFGQANCFPLRPLCAACPVQMQCPSSELRIPAQDSKKPTAASGASSKKKQKKRKRAASETEKSEAESMPETSEDDEATPPPSSSSRSTRRRKAPAAQSADASGNESSELSDVDDGDYA